MSTNLEQFAQIEMLNTLECVADALCSARALLARCEQGPCARTWQPRLDRYTRFVSTWNLFPPSALQVHAMIECLAELVELMERSAPSRSGVYRLAGDRISSATRS